MSEETRVAIGALETSGRRTKTHDDVINVKLPKAVKQIVKKIAEEQGVSDSAIVRVALGEYLKRRGYNH